MFRKDQLEYVLFHLWTMMHKYCMKYFSEKEEAVRNIGEQKTAKLQRLQTLKGTQGQSDNVSFLSLCCESPVILF